MFAALNVLESSRAEITNLYDPKNNPSLSEKTNKLAQLVILNPYYSPYSNHNSPFSMSSFLFFCNTRRIIDVRNGIKNSRVNKKMKKELYYLCNEIYMWLQMVIWCVCPTIRSCL